jgi:type IV secretion system protein VirD4
MTMRRTIYVGHILTAVLGMLATSGAMTQYLASAFHYSSHLGASWFRLLEVPIYSPVAWLPWLLRYGSKAPAVFDRANYILFAGMGVVVVAEIALAALRGRDPVAAGSHGTARWAEHGELARAGLLTPAGGVVLCQTEDAKLDIYSEQGSTRLRLKREGELITHNGPEHVLCFAPSRSGKGVGLVIPTLLSWIRSALVYDPKKELWFATAGWRSQFSHCWRFEPTNPAIRFNPLHEIRRGESEVRDAQVVADMLVDPDGSKEHRDHWQMTAHTLLVGAILHTLYACREKSLAGVAAFLSEPSRTQYETLELMLDTRHMGGVTHPVVAAAARESLNKSENELSGVFSTALTFLSLYRDPIIARATSRSDFRIVDLMNAENPASLYLVIPPSDFTRLRPLLRLMLNQIVNRLTESLDPKHAPRHRLLGMIDEFPTLGKLPFLESALAFTAGYGIRWFLIAQSLKQLESAYGPNHSFMDNTHVRLTYAANCDRTAERISAMLGQATITTRHQNLSGARLGPWMGHLSESEQQHGRPLLTPGEILQLPADEALLFVGNLLPYRAKKVVYYQDSRFKSRANLPPPEDAAAQQRERISGTVSDGGWSALPLPPVPPPRSDAQPEPSEQFGFKSAPAASPTTTPTHVADVSRSRVMPPPSQPRPSSTPRLPAVETTEAKSEDQALAAVWDAMSVDPGSEEAGVGPGDGDEQMKECR